MGPGAERDIATGQHIPFEMYLRRRDSGASPESRGTKKTRERTRNCRRARHTYKTPMSPVLARQILIVANMPSIRFRIRTQIQCTTTHSHFLCGYAVSFHRKLRCARSARSKPEPWAEQRNGDIRLRRATTLSSSTSLRYSAVRELLQFCLRFMAQSPRLFKDRTAILLLNHQPPRVLLLIPKSSQRHQAYQASPEPRRRNSPA